MASYGVKLSLRRFAFSRVCTLLGFSRNNCVGVSRYSHATPGLLSACVVQTQVVKERKEKLVFRFFYQLS